MLPAVFVIGEIAHPLPGEEQRKILTFGKQVACNDLRHLQAPRRQYGQIGLAKGSAETALHCGVIGKEGLRGGFLLLMHEIGKNATLGHFRHREM
ncbi:hypothetical protein J4E08_00290 [Sagittula sp. NFXS13]|uniref:hypothetical protein n=1 Tax=Sagittula sp. NFXS13 TaxID=2819095 RepID=UPI0032DF0967